MQENVAYERPMRRSLQRLEHEFTTKPRKIAQIVNQLVIDRLNELPESAATKRVSRFIHLFNRAHELNDLFRLFFESREDMLEFLYRSPDVAKCMPVDQFGTGWLFKFPDMQALNTQLNQTLAELNKLAARYSWHPFVRHRGYEFCSLEVTEDWTGQAGRQQWENRAIWWLCGRNSKWIDFCRRCRDCNRWFFALSEHQSYCGDACRKRYASHGEEFKERRRAYMRSYRLGEKEREASAKNLLSKGPASHRRPIEGTK